MCQCGKNSSVAMCAECPPGEPGARGQSIGILLTPEAPGVNCIYGGQKIEVGIDTDFDGVPDTILQTKYLCNAKPGTDGSAVTFITGTITTLSAGSSATASVVATGTPNQYQINLGIPRGADGTTPTLVTGTITTVAAGSPATASIVATGTPNQYQINMGIPNGATGATPAASAYVINGMSIPSCFTGIVNNGDSLLAFLQAYANSICALSSGSLAPNIFKATKNVPQTIRFITTTLFDINFPDDSTPGNYDNGNNFLLARYTAPSTLTKTYILENVRIKIGSGGWASITNTVVLELVKNVAGVITVLATSGAAMTYTSADSFGQTPASANGYTFVSLGGFAITLNVGEQVYGRFKTTNVVTTEEFDILVGGKLSSY